MFEGYLCKLDDFQALIAAIVLVVGLLQSADSEDEMKDTEDLKLLEDVKGVFGVLKMEQNGAIVRQGLRVLETLGKFTPGTGGGGEYNDDGRGKRSVTLFVPYLGAISVEVRPWRTSVSVEGSSLEEESPSDPTFGLEDEGIGFDHLDRDGNGKQEHSNEFFDFDGLAYEADFDWERLLLGTELDQDWNQQFGVD